jgi:2-amino-4-hydroxy-6-hydroxymethyldihydropteridine diphosphokinase
VTTAFVALGSNLGDRRAHLERGAARLAETCAIPGTLRLSHIYSTPPWGGIRQPDYLNAIARFEADVAPQEILDRLLAIESECGRIRDGEKWGARTLDLDLIDYGGLTMETPALVLPHPRVAERAFVLVPLCEIQPDWRHPLTGRTAAEMLIILDPDPEAARVDGPFSVPVGGEERGRDPSGAAGPDIHRD